MCIMCDTVLYICSTYICVNPPRLVAWLHSYSLVLPPPLLAEIIHITRVTAECGRECGDQIYTEIFIPLILTNSRDKKWCTVENIGLSGPRPKSLCRDYSTEPHPRYIIRQNWSYGSCCTSLKCHKTIIIAIKTHVPWLKRNTLARKPLFIFLFNGFTVIQCNTVCLLHAFITCQILFAFLWNIKCFASVAIAFSLW